VAINFLEFIRTWAPIFALLPQAFVLSRFLDARNRDYPLAIAYSAILFALTAIALLSRNPSQLSTVYLAFEAVMHLLLLALMLQLTSRTKALLGQSRQGNTLLWAITVVVTATAIWAYSSQPLAAQFTKVRQVISFWMVLINLYWWSLLLRQRGLDRRVLLLSAGIGLQMTGQVVSDGLFAMVRTRADMALLYGATLLVFLTHFASLIAWYVAFDPKNAKSRPAPSLTLA
jgi:hypothetical protein